MELKSVTSLLAGVILVFSACGKPEGTVLGKAPRGEPRTILAVRDGLTPPDVTISGEIVEKCPTAGCWFYVADQTGVIKVDTKNAGFVVSEIALKTPVTVAGKILQQGDETVLDASGLRY